MVDSSKRAKQPIQALLGYISAHEADGHFVPLDPEALSRLAAAGSRGGEELRVRKHGRNDADRGRQSQTRLANSGHRRAIPAREPSDAQEVPPSNNPTNGPLAPPPLHEHVLGPIDDDRPAGRQRLGHQNAPRLHLNVDHIGVHDVHQLVEAPEALPEPPIPPQRHRSEVMHRCTPRQCARRRCGTVTSGEQDVEIDPDLHCGFPKRPVGVVCNPFTRRRSVLLVSSRTGNVEHSHELSAPHSAMSSSLRSSP